MDNLYMLVAIPVMEKALEDAKTTDALIRHRLKQTISFSVNRLQGTLPAASLVDANIAHIMGPFKSLSRRRAVHIVGDMILQIHAFEGSDVLAAAVDVERTVEELLRSYSVKKQSRMLNFIESDEFINNPQLYLIDL